MRIIVCCQIGAAELSWMEEGDGSTCELPNDGNSHKRSPWLSEMTTQHLQKWQHSNNTSFIHTRRLTWTDECSEVHTWNILYCLTYWSLDRPSNICRICLNTVYYRGTPVPATATAPSEMLLLLLLQMYILLILITSQYTTGKYQQLLTVQLNRVSTNRLWWLSSAKQPEMFQ